MLVSAANQSHTCKALLQATAHGARTMGFCFVGFHVGFQLSGYGGGHHGKGTMGVHVGFHVGFHAGFQLSGYGGGHHGKGTMGVHVGFHVGFPGGPCWVPCWLPCWFPGVRVWGRSPWERYRGGPCWVPCWLPCWAPAARVWGRSPWERYRGGPCWVPCWSMLASMLASMLVSSFQGMEEVTMGKVPWGSMLGSMLASVGSMLGSMLASVLVSRCEGMGEVTMGKVPWGSMLGAMLASMLGSSCQGMGEVTMGKIVGFQVGFHVGSCKIYLPITEVFRARSIQNIRTQNAAHGDPTGCPWSAYLFLLVMTCVDSDGKSRSSGHALNSRIPGAGFDAVYYADDTILFSTTPRGLNEILKHMEDCSGHYASKLNRGKCHSLNLHREANIHFRDGTVLHKAQDATYLGNNLNHIANPKREIRQRIQDVMTTWRGLAISWKASSAGKKRQLVIYDAVVKSCFTTWKPYTLLDPCVKSWRPSSCTVYGKSWSYPPFLLTDGGHMQGYTNSPLKQLIQTILPKKLDSSQKNWMRSEFVWPDTYCRQLMVTPLDKLYVSTWQRWARPYRKTWN